MSRSSGALVALGAALAGALALVFALSTNAIVALMQVPAEAVAPARQYLFICACGLVFITGYNMVSAVLRGRRRHRGRPGGEPLSGPGGAAAPGLPL